MCNKPLSNPLYKTITFQVDKMLKPKFDGPGGSHDLPVLVWMTVVQPQKVARNPWATDAALYMLTI